MEARTWTLEEARQALPRVIATTARAFEEFTALYNEIKTKIQPEVILEAKEEELQNILADWARDIQNMGAESKGLWLVDFDYGNGYYCWKYGEDALLYEHGYEEGFAGRHLITEE